MSPLKNLLAGALPKQTTPATPAVPVENPLDKRPPSRPKVLVMTPDGRIHEVRPIPKSQRAIDERTERPNAQTERVLREALAGIEVYEASSLSDFAAEISGGL